ncbi:hypothetical protein BP5796_00631 [Coleophoma crateriformis]|uniref:Uncharacterized protein n=1 Tax=Coleophoma crateriformis TaxID=565419 RepID=A0A3D8TA38_9HELO|nr:hypothetical protein BP5796_00631 [Coleophoma crateriformis]
MHTGQLAFKHRETRPALRVDDIHKGALLGYVIDVVIAAAMSMDVIDTQMRDAGAAHSVSNGAADGDSFGSCMSVIGEARERNDFLNVGEGQEAPVSLKGMESGIEWAMENDGKEAAVLQEIQPLEHKQTVEEERKIEET